MTVITGLKTVALNIICSWLNCVCFCNVNCTVRYATHQRSSVELTTDQRTLRTAGSYLITSLHLFMCTVVNMLCAVKFETCIINNIYITVNPDLHSQFKILPHVKFHFLLSCSLTLHVRYKFKVKSRTSIMLFIL